LRVFVAEELFENVVSADTLSKAPEFEIAAPSLIKYPW